MTIIFGGVKVEVNGRVGLKDSLRTYDDFLNLEYDDVNRIINPKSKFVTKCFSVKLLRISHEVLLRMKVLFHQCSLK